LLVTVTAAQFTQCDNAIARFAAPESVQQESTGRSAGEPLLEKLVEFSMNFIFRSTIVIVIIVIIKSLL
jgi:hypothetical protein